MAQTRLIARYSLLRSAWERLERMHCWLTGVGMRILKVRGVETMRSHAGAWERGRIGWQGGFTIIELLVVISIIALLASLTVGLSGLATRKSREARVKGELSHLTTAIDNYTAAIGAPPRDNPGRPSTNQLFYELSGTVFEGQGNRGVFSIPNTQEAISAQAVGQFFGAPGFGNSVRSQSGEKPKFVEEFKPSQYKEINSNPDVEILVVPVKGPDRFTFQGRTAQLWIKGTDGTRLNPWLYDVSSPNRNNRRQNGYDLWTEVVIGKKIFRFSNWEKEPVVIGQVP